MKIIAAEPVPLGWRVQYEDKSIREIAFASVRSDEARAVWMNYHEIDEAAAGV